MEEERIGPQPSQPPADAPSAATPPLAIPAWRDGLPELLNPTVLLREVGVEDAPALLAHLGTAEVSRFIQPLPTTVEGFEGLITSARRERADGRGVCYSVVPAGGDHAVGIFRLTALEAGFATAEGTCVLGSAYWGSGLFLATARMVLDFAFDTLGVVRLEARAVTMDGRGNGALRKVGAVQEGVLRRSFKRYGKRYDQLLWSVLAEDWRLQTRGRSRPAHRSRP